MRKRGLYGQTVTVYHPMPMKKRVDRYVLRDVFCQIGSREVPDAAGAKSGAAMLLVVLAVLGGIGALVYFKFIKQKPKTKGSDNLDDYDYGEDDTEQEDEDPWETEESDEPEDAGGGGDEESENPAK